MLRVRVNVTDIPGTNAGVVLVVLFEVVAETSANRSVAKSILLTRRAAYVILSGNGHKHLNR